jgi:hypothetical protein
MVGGGLDFLPASHWNTKLTSSNKEGGRRDGYTLNSSMIIF